MTLTFPNRSRSFDEGRKAVRFTAYDGMFEVPFYVHVDAFARPGPSEDIEQHYLRAFDADRSNIIEVARETYAQTRQTMYFLAAADFR